MKVFSELDRKCVEELINSNNSLPKEDGIPLILSELSVQISDLGKWGFILADACASENPFQPTKEEVIAISEGTEEIKSKKTCFFP